MATFRSRIGSSCNVSIKKALPQKSDCFFARERGPTRLRRSFKQILDRGRADDRTGSEREERLEREAGERRLLEEGQLGGLDSLKGQNIGNAEEGHR